MAINIGFIGLGIMGRPMALNLLKAGHTLHVYARRAQSLRPLLAAGAKHCSSPAQAAQRSDVVFTMVSDSADVQDVLLGANGVVHGASKGLIVVDMSTIAPGVAKATAKQLAKHGVEMLDAPVSGGESGAINGTLSIMVGGKKAAFEQVKPLLACLGKHIVHVGHRGAGQVAKACNQMLVALTIAGVGEALTFARRSGVDAAKIREALLGGFAYSRILEIHGRRMLERDFKPGFKAKLHQKDMRIVLESAHQLGLALPGAALAAQYLNALVGAGDGDLDSSALFKVVEKMSA
ncbi:MAG: 2-hydroxy-3-oxopropionate reductase [Burkholderiales bacterium]